MISLKSINAAFGFEGDCKKTSDCKKKGGDISLKEIELPESCVETPTKFDLIFN